MDVAVICSPRVAQFSGFADRAWHFTGAGEAVLLLRRVPPVMRGIGVERLHGFVIGVESAIEFIQYRVSCYFDLVHIRVVALNNSIQRTGVAPCSCGYFGFGVIGFSPSLMSALADISFARMSAHRPNASASPSS